MSIIKETENSELRALANFIEKTAKSLHTAMKYVYAVSYEDFYNVNAKDLFKVGLADISNPNILSNLGVSLKGKTEGLDSLEFDKVANMIFYAFAVRTPFLRRREDVSSKALNGAKIRDLFTLCVEAGAEDFGGLIGEDFKAMSKLAKTALPEPNFTGEWFRRWVYAKGGELAAITNENMFFLGCSDALFPLFYAKLTDALAEFVKRR